MTHVGAKNTTIDKISDCLANAIYTLIDRKNGDLKTPIMVVTEDTDHGLVRAGIYANNFDIVTRDFNGKLNDSTIKDGLRVLKESVQCDMDMEVIEC